MKTTTFIQLSGLSLALALMASPLTTFAQETESPPVKPVALTEANEVASAEGLVAVLESNGNYTTLLSAIERTGMDDALGQEGPFTLLAPTDEAFAGVNLDDYSFEELVRLIRHHLVVDEVTAEQASKYGAIMTANGDVLTVEDTEEGVQVEKAAIVEANMNASNGLIHGVNAVMMPPAQAVTSEVKDNAEAAPDSKDQEIR